MDVRSKAVAAEDPTFAPFTISRVFDAPPERVWKAWTEASHLQNWFGPKGCTLRVARLEFRPGGIFHYCMTMPDGKEMWGKWTFSEIVAPRRMVLIQSFSDANGGITRHPLSPGWPLEMRSTTTVVAEGNKARLTIEWSPHHATADERAVFDAARDGMTQGWTGTFEQLQSYLAQPN